MSANPYTAKEFWTRAANAPALAKLRFPCSAGQRRFWVLDQLESGNPSLNVAVRWRLEGEVANADLETAFRTIIARHQTLRTSFAGADGEPVQIVEPHIQFHIPVVDLRALPERDALTESERISKLEARVSFDLSAPPLIRVTHLRLRQKVSILLVTAHHIICDGWSIGILAHEMGEICAALHTVRQPELPELPVSYGEFSAWQAEYLSGDVLRAETEFWQRTLQGLKHFELMPDRPRQLVQTTNSNILSVLLDRGLTEALAEMARRHGCTLFMTSLAALLTMLHRYTGEADIGIGTQVASRDEIELENLVGLFLNTVVLRHDLSGDPSFAELLARVSETVTESFEHQRVPLEKILEIVKPPRDPSRNPLFSVNFMLQRSFIKNNNYGSFRLVDLPSYSPGAIYDLNFFMVERPEGWRLSCEYNTDLFDASTVNGLLRHFANILRAAVTDATRAISALPLLAPAERNALLFDWNRTAADYPEQLTLPELFVAQVRRSPDAVALVCGEQSMTYRQLDAAANRLANELRGRGLAPATRIGVFLERSAELVVALLAISKSGSAYIPLDPAHPPERFGQMLRNSRPSTVITQMALCERLAGCGMPLFVLDTESLTIARQSDAAPGVVASPDDPAYIIYTSGSTGQPKGVEVPHRALVNLLWAVRGQPGLTAEDRFVFVATVAFDAAVLEIFLPLVVGARVVVAREAEALDGHELLQLLRRHAATAMFATPARWLLLLEAGWRGDPQLKMLCGGEAMSRQLADNLLACGGELWNVYGPTETTIFSSVLRIGPGDGAVPLGPPLPNYQFYVLDGRQRLLPPGAPGELYIGGDGVALGYLDLPEMTRERFIPDPFRNAPGARLYRTGDLVRWRQPDRMEYLGRADHQIKLRGFRIELGEIEAVLRRHPDVAEAVAVVGKDAIGGDAIWAYVVPRHAQPGGYDALVGSLRADLGRWLPAYMHPSSILALEALPHSPNGKVDRKVLPKPAASAAAAAAPLGSEMERHLAAIWCGVLGLPAIASTANFFELGGHSLLAARMLSRVKAELGYRVSLATLFRAPSIRELAKLMVHNGAREYDFRQVVTLQPNGARPPLIAIHNTGIYYGLARHLGQNQPFTSLQLFDPSFPANALPKTFEEVAAGYVQLIRRVQPQGPYALLGWCLAGTLAFEVARQLLLKQQEVSQLILIDTWIPRYLKRLPRMRALIADYSTRWQLIMADWSRVMARQRSFAEFLANRVLIKKLLRWLGRPVSAADLPVTFESRTISAENYDQWLLGYLRDLAERYEPKTYPGKITLFRSSREPKGPFLDHQMGWTRFATGGVEVTMIDGDHFTMFQEPGVASMAGHISAALDSRPSEAGQPAHGAPSAPVGESP